MNSLTSAKGYHALSVIYGLVHVYPSKCRKGSNPAKVLREPLIDKNIWCSREGHVWVDYGSLSAANIRNHCTSEYDPKRKISDSE